MVTNSLQQFVGSRALFGFLERRSNSNVLQRTLRRVGQFFCGFRGHDLVLHFEDRRMLLHCTSCGYDSPGWALGERSPRLIYHGDAGRHSLRRPAIPRTVDRSTPIQLAQKKTA